MQEGRRQTAKGKKASFLPFFNWWADGAIASYDPLLQSALDFVPETPLPELVKATSKGPIAQFKVVFTRKGILEVSPWHGWKNSR